MIEIDAVDTIVRMLEEMPNRPTTIYDNNEIPARAPFLIFDVIPIGKDVRGLKYQAITTGTVQITVVTQGGIGPGTAEEIARRVAACFPAGRVMDGVRIDRPPELVKGYPDAGLWRLPIKIRWKVLPV